MIVTENLSKSFPTPDGPDKYAVRDLNLRIEEGEIYGLLGPNGAGKTTTLRMLSGLVTPTAGTARLAGYDVAAQPFEVKRILGFLTANTGLYQRLTPRELLAYFGELHLMTRARARRRAEEIIDWLDMADFADLRCGSLSTGQRQRVNIGRVLVADPPILIMDEPTLGLDVLSNRTILEFIRRAGRSGKTIIVSTHYLDEAESLCDRIGLLHRGSIVAEGSLDELRQQTGEQRLSSIFLDLVGADPVPPIAGAGVPIA
ncbi:MAG: ATP-binding cassette domain-containing protein [Phycisphaerales bacterium]|nr:MAG: ATP-binding cassette domain-containing protein [Phycisphaerales bacterium]